MSNTVNVFKMMDGPSHVTLHVFLQSDGASGELTNYCILDPAVDLSPAMPRKQDLILKQLWHEIFGFSAVFAFNALNPWPFWTITPTSGLHHDWRFFGGVRDNSSAPLGLDSDGKLLLSTYGFTDAQCNGGLVLWLEKRDRLNPQGG